MGTPKLTVVAVFYNEALRLPGYFKNVQGVADEIVIVDCSSTDATSKICRRNGAKVIRSPYRYFEQNVNKALSRVRKGDWALVLDADERLSPELKREIRGSLGKPGADVYFIKRINYLFDGFSTKSTINTWLPRLFRKGCVRWEQEMPHEKPVVEGEQARLKSLFFHYAYPDVPSYVQKMEDYLCRLPSEYDKKDQKKVRISEREGKDISVLFGNHGVRRLFFYPPAAILNYLFRRRLILDGMRGVIFSICAGIYAFFEEAIWWGEQARGRVDWKREYPGR